MVEFLKAMQSAFQKVMAELPDGVRTLTEFAWKCRWFIVAGFVLYAMYNVVMVMLPYLMWSFLIKMVMSAVLPFLF